MAEVNITIKATDKASEVLKRTANVTNEVATAMTRMIVQERNNRILDEAKKQFDQLTESEKKWALAAYDAAEAQDKANKELEEAGKSNKASMKFTELKSQLDLLTGAARTVKESFEKAFEFGKQGAAIQQTTESFGLLLEKVEAAPDLLDKLRAASRGTIDDQRLMSSTATLLAGAEGQLATALADATPRLMEIAKAANKLNPTLGDTTFMYESLATGIKRASPMILDNLGLTVRIGEANEKMAKSLGKSVEQLTAEEQKMALLNATMEAGNVLIEQVGGNVDAATDAYARFEAAQKNFSDQQMQTYGPALSWVIEKQSAMMENTREAGTSWMTYVPILQQVHGLYQALAALAGKTVEPPVDPNRGNDAWGGRYQAQVDAYVAAVEEADQAQRDYAASTDRLAMEEEHASDVGWSMTYMIRDKAAATREAKEAEKEALAVMEETNRLLDKQAAAQQKLSDAQQASNEGFGDKNVQLLDKYNVSGEKRTDVLEVMDKRLGTNYVAQEKLDKEMDKAIQLYATGQITIEELAEKMDSSKAAWDAMNDNIRAARDGLHEANQALLDFMKTVQSADGMVATILVETQTTSTSSSGRGSRGGDDSDLVGDNFRASGGPVTAGRPYIVGERGWEVFVPPASGYIVNHNDAVAAATSGAGGSTVINQYIYDITDWELAAQRVTEIQRRNQR